MCCGTPHMQQALLLVAASSRSGSASSPDAGCRTGLLLLTKKLPWKLAASRIPWTRRGSRRMDRVIAAAAGREQEHYAVLGISRRASAADVKSAYRLLARKYHPDVSRDPRAPDLFKSVRLAYEVLSDEGRRAQYDRELVFREAARSSRRANRAYDADLSDSRRMHRWAELRRQMQNRHGGRTGRGAAHAQKDGDPRSDGGRGPFGEVLWSAFCTLFLVRTVGARIALALSSLAALFDHRLDAGYKMGYATAWLLGGQGGVLLAMSISFASWVFGKNSSGLVALVAVAMWVAGNLAAFVPIPRGAILTLLYMSLRAQVGQK